VSHAHKNYNLAGKSPENLRRIISGVNNGSVYCRNTMPGERRRAWRQLSPFDVGLWPMWIIICSHFYGWTVVRRKVYAPVSFLFFTWLIIGKRQTRRKQTKTVSKEGRGRARVILQPPRRDPPTSAGG
jgi:hypothetical protein